MAAHRARGPRAGVLAVGAVVLLAGCTLTAPSGVLAAGAPARLAAVLKRLRVADSTAAGGPVVGPGGAPAAEAADAPLPPPPLGDPPQLRVEGRGKEPAAAAGTPPPAAGNASGWWRPPACAGGWSVPRWGDPEANAALREVQDFLAAALRGNGLHVTTPRWPRCLSRPAGSTGSCAGRVNVVTFPCLPAAAPSVAGALPPGTALVLANWELLAGSPGCLHDPRLRPLWGGWPVWEYTALNAAELARAGLLQPPPRSRGGGAGSGGSGPPGSGGSGDGAGSAWGANVALLTLGHYPGLVAPELEAPPPLPPLGAPPRQPTQVLLLGDPTNPRRRRIVAALRARGVAVRAATGVHGRQRDAAVRGSQVVLNVHEHPRPSHHAMEAAQLSAVLSAGAAVVTEGSPDAAAVALWRGAARVAGFYQLAEATVALLANATARHELAVRGHALMRAATPAQRLAPALRMAWELLGGRAAGGHGGCAPLLPLTNASGAEGGAEVGEEEDLEEGD